MRVLQFGMSSRHGGVESFILNYARHLKAEGIVFDYVDTLGDGLTNSGELIENGSVIHTLKDCRKHPVYGYQNIKRIIRDGGYTCVHINMLSAANPVPVIAALRAKAHVIVHSHNSRTVGIHRKILHAINSVFLRMLPVTRLACSHEAGKWMFGSREYQVVPNAIYADRYKFDTEARRALRAEAGIPEGAVVLGFVGRLFAQKNPLYLVKILHAVKQKISADVKLLIVGDGELMEDVRSAASDLGIASDIVCVGRQENVASWYSAMDAMLLPSLWEGLPLVGVEAQAAGLPCFLSDNITEETVLTDLVHFCHLTENGENWAEQIIKSLDRSEDRCQYAVRVAQSGFSIANAANLLRKLYFSKEDSQGVNGK